MAFSVSLTGAEAAQTVKSAHPLVEAARRKDIWNALLTLRTFNAVLLWTFFQPDEYYQAQEPAWKIAFGKGVHPWKNGAHDGPWITWEWEHRLRSSLYPFALGVAYQAFGLLGDTFFPPVIRTQLLLAPPKLFGAFCAALMEYYTWKLSGRIFGAGSVECTAVLMLTVLSPWQWFVSTRTLSNCLETTLTVIALYQWPWSWFSVNSAVNVRKEAGDRLKYSIFFAGVATVLRPTNIIIWICMCILTALQSSVSEFFTLVRSSILVACLVLMLSSGLDFFYYGELTFPPLNFLSFNIVENAAEFYGRMRPDYYFTEGIPLLLMTTLPFGLIGVVKALSPRYSPAAVTSKGNGTESSILRALALVALAVPMVLSFVGHKEVRFIYPTLPLFLILAARPLVEFFDPFPLPASRVKRFILILLVVVNGTVAIYLGFFHGRGVIAAQTFLRAEHERLNPGMVASAQIHNVNTTQVGFLMPCHSVPWRSQLIYADIEAWALTCDPPLGLRSVDKRTYKDEADVFFEDPVTWMKSEFGLRRRFWPMYLVFFEQLTQDLKSTVSEGSYEEAWRGFNSLWHDDWRRQGDVVIWVKTKDFGGPGRASNGSPLGTTSALPYEFAKHFAKFLG